jgi:lipoic acid synthetase
VVITSPARDDLSDGGAKQFYDITKDILKHSPKTDVELLIPDFKNDIKSIQKVVKSGAKIIGHNIETVPRLYHIRKKSNYKRSLDVLKNLKLQNPNIKTKTALMVGLGETKDEMVEVFKDLIDVDCRLLSIGQYLAPNKTNEKVVEYIKPSLFNEYRQIALNLGFDYVKSSPYTRSSYLAHEYI